MAVTSKDIARELKLSQPTVSRILSGDPNHRASFATRERVLQAAEQLGYRPNAIARSLRRGRTDVIGLYSSGAHETSEDVHGTVVSALRRQCAARGLDLLLYSDMKGQTSGETLAKVNDGRVDGLIVYGGKDDPLVQIAGRAAIPIAAMVHPIPDLFSVTFDDASAMDKLVSHYWWRGYRKFVFVGPSRPTPSSERLLAAFQAEMDRRCVRLDNRSLWTAAPNELSPLAAQLRSATDRTAVCCWTDVVAYNLRLALLAKSIDVPERIAVSGFGGYLPEFLSAGVLSMRCDWDKAASAALDWMIERVKEKTSTQPFPSEIRLPLDLTDGECD